MSLTDPTMPQVVGAAALLAAAVLVWLCAWWVRDHVKSAAADREMDRDWARVMAAPLPEPWDGDSYAYEPARPLIFDTAELPLVPDSDISGPLPVIGQPMSEDTATVDECIAEFKAQADAALARLGIPLG